MRIKEFAEFTGVSVRTLHYYDEIGLLTPAFVDKTTGYRFYNEKSFLRMQEILFYRELDFSLKSIGEILSQRNDICNYAIIESALVIPSKLTHSMIAPAFGTCYGLIQYNWFSKLQFKSLKIKSDLFDHYFKDTCAISKKDMIAFLQANSLYSLKESIKKCTAKVYVFVGGKEKNAMQKSAKVIHQALQESILQILPGLYHGEFSINQGKDYANKIREIIADL